MGGGTMGSANGPDRRGLGPSTPTRIRRRVRVGATLSGDPRGAWTPGLRKKVLSRRCTQLVSRNRVTVGA